MALFTGLHINITNHHDALIFVLGVFLGSTIWWFLLCFTVALFRKKISLEIVQCINYAAGIVIFSFGLYTFSTFISHNFFWTLCKTTRLAMWLII
jgi:arginine exporter protein ArgO